MSEPIIGSPALSRVTFATRMIHSVLRHSAAYMAISSAILLLDWLTGPFLQFPILFVVPVALSAWFVPTRLTYALAMVLPLGRLAIAALGDSTTPFVYSAANCLTRIAVITFIAYLVRRVARQTKMLEARIDAMVTICAWSRTIEYAGEWVSFEEYLLRKFNIVASHGISPQQAGILRAAAHELAPGTNRQRTP